jgi:LPXTG-site transpeptidase (sortase) family protein
VARVQGLVGSLLMVVGVVLLLATAGLYGYGELERVQFERGRAERDRIEAATATTEALRLAYETGVAGGEATATEVARGVASATAAAEATATAAAAATAAASRPTALPGVPTATAAPTAPPTPTVPAATPTPAAPTATAVPVVIRRVFARAIGLDAEVVESKIVNGEWQVPRFVAGHLQGTSVPGSGGNIVLSGHVQSITAGNVFARIDKLQIGDEVTLRTTAGEVVYRIRDKNIVKNDDLSVVQSGQDEELTLITCTGTYNILKQDYTHRWVVWGTRVS